MFLASIILRARLVSVYTYDGCICVQPSPIAVGLKHRTAAAEGSVPMEQVYQESLFEAPCCLVPWTQCPRAAQMHWMCSQSTASGLALPERKPFHILCNLVVI